MKGKNRVAWHVFVNKVVEHEIDFMMKKELNCGPFISSSATPSDFSFDCLSMLESKDFL